ncbi:hypothetical protein PRNP1_001786 [Phytophthora ramorum]
MATLYGAPRLTLGQPLPVSHVTTRSPTYTSAMDSDGSSESDNELLMSLIVGPDLDCPLDEFSDRGDRPFPYTRSKTRWRKRPNDELKYLRRRAAELERLLASLSRSDSRLRDDDNNSFNQTEALLKLSDESHTRKMKASLMENRKLRAKVESQFQVAKALQAAIDENMRLRAREICWPSSAAASDELVFALLDEGKEQQYAATDKVLAESGVARMYHPFFSQLVLHRDATGISFQHTDVRLLPVGVADVARALRYSLSHGSRVGPSEHCRKVKMQDGFSHAVTVDNVEVVGALPAEVKARHLLWSVAETDRTVINWTSFVEYNGSRRIRLQKRIWFYVEPMHLQNGAQGCILRTVVRFTPVDTDLDLAHIEEMAETVKCAYQRDSVRVILSVRDQLAAAKR